MGQVYDPTFRQFHQIHYELSQKQSLTHCVLRVSPKSWSERMDETPLTESLRSQGFTIAG